MDIDHHGHDGLIGAPAAEAQHWTDSPPALQAGGIRLREPRLADAPSLFRNLADAEVARYMSVPPSTRAGFEQFISWMQHERQAGRCVCFAVLPHEAGEAVGLIQFRQLDPAFGSAEWGFALGQTYWGRLMFARSALLAVDFIFRHVGAYRLEARAAVENRRGNNALRRLGATQEGTLRKSLLGSAQPLDQYLWSLLQQDWLAAHPSPAYELTLTAPQQPEVSPAPPATVTSECAWRQALPALRSSRATLRQLQLTDAASLLEMFSAPAVSRFILPPPSTQSSIEKFITWTWQQRAKGKVLCYGVVPAGGEHAVGVFQLQMQNERALQAEWGFAIGVPFWGTGLFVEGARLFLDFAFDVVRLQRLEARAAVANERGNGALRKMGAVCEGNLKRSFLLGGRYFDDALWALLPEDWRRRSAELESGAP